MKTDDAADKEERLERFFERYEAEHPYALCLLKSHLLMEEALEEIIISVCRDPGSVRDAKLSFFQKLMFAKAIDGSSSGIWVCLERLNSARNELAHGRKISHLEKKIDSFLSTVTQHRPKFLLTGDRARDLELAVCGLHGGLSRVAFEYVCTK